MKKQTSVFENSLIWFGAGVSIAEILTGTYFAPLGFEKGILDSLPAGKISTLQAIHRYLFEDIYEFAGEIRKVNMAKGNFRFAPLMYNAVEKNHYSALRTRNGALNRDYILFCVYLNDTEVLNGYALVTEVSCHLLALENS